MEQPQQNPIRILIDHLPIQFQVSITVLAKKRSPAPQAVAQSLEISKQWGQLQQQEH